MTLIREIHGTNFYWYHVRYVKSHELMRDVYRFRCGLSHQWPSPLRHDIKPIKLK